MKALLRKGAAAGGVPLGGNTKFSFIKAVENAKEEQERLLVEVASKPGGVEKMVIYLRRATGGPAEQAELVERMAALCRDVGGVALKLKEEGALDWLLSKLPEQYTPPEPETSKPPARRKKRHGRRGGSGSGGEGRSGSNGTSKDADREGVDGVSDIAALTANLFDAAEHATDVWADGSGAQRPAEADEGEEEWEEYYSSEEDDDNDQDDDEDDEDADGLASTRKLLRQVDAKLSAAPSISDHDELLCNALSLVGSLARATAVRDAIRDLGGIPRLIYTCQQAMDDGAYQCVCRLLASPCLALPCLALPCLALPCLT